MSKTPARRLYRVKKNKKNPDRDYRKETLRYDSSPARMAARRARNRNRYALEKAGKVRVGDGKDVHHKDGNWKNNSKSNLKVTNASKNRSYARTKTARKKNPRA